MPISHCKTCSIEFKYHPSRSTGTYCSTACHQTYQSKQYIDDWLAGGKVPGPRTLRKYLAEERGKKCEVCAIIDWNGKPITLEVDHVDGNPYNNLPDNLRFICPNCHSQTDTYKNKNKGNGRVSRRERARLDYHRQTPE
jgi:hypothetical protein